MPLPPVCRIARNGAHLLLVLTGKPHVTSRTSNLPLALHTAIRACGLSPASAPAHLHPAALFRAVGSEYVRLATISDARQLYLSQCDRANSQNTLLVLYAPWCPHCREMEDEVGSGKWERGERREGQGRAGRVVMWAW